MNRLDPLWQRIAASIERQAGLATAPEVLEFDLQGAPFRLEIGHDGFKMVLDRATLDGKPVTPEVMRGLQYMLGQYHTVNEFKRGIVSNFKIKGGLFSILQFAK